MARLTAAARRALPASDFAGPHRTFPVNDKAHARAAIMLSHFRSGRTAHRIEAKAERVLDK